MLGLTKYAIEKERKREVNATQILCDLYIDIVPTVLLNNIIQCAYLKIVLYKYEKTTTMWLTV